MVVEYKHDIVKYHKPNTMHEMFEEPKSARRRVQEEGNVRRSISQRNMTSRLQNCEIFLGNEVTDSGDLVHFEVIVEFKDVNS